MTERLRRPDDTNRICRAVGEPERSMRGWTACSRVHVFVNCRSVVATQAT